MKLIKPSVEILEQGPGEQGIYDMIELCGKTSYKSPVKGGEEAKKFVDARIKDGHNAVLEFGTVYLTVTDQRLIDNNAWKVWSSPYTQVNRIGLNNYVTTNYRVLVENNALSTLEFLSEPTEFHPKRYCVRFITDRGVSHELVRHRKMSFCQESTRYCNYSRDKFGNELTFIEPTWYADSENVIKSSFVSLLRYSEDAYLDLLDHQYTPQQARQVLPNALKTEICVCGFEEDWKHFFDLRCAKNAHPDMQVLAKQLKEQFIENKYI
jgi:thymidylate synthase (FAD)